MKPSIFNFTLAQLQDELVKQGFKKYLASQVYDWVYQKNVYDFAAMSNIAINDRDKLSELYDISLLKTHTVQEARDGTVKFLFQLSDGFKIETVLMRQSYGNSVCVTTQVGCNMGCKFCASGILKKTRNLTTAEIVLQIILVNQYLGTTEERVTHLVIMGIGEPFDNFENVLNFIHVINDPKGYQIGIRHMTVSTCGLVPKIIEFADLELQVNLAISLHAPNDELRTKLMPINKAYPLGKLMDAVRYYIEKTNRRITFEYIMIKNVNDSEALALQLVALIRGLNAYVNLIPYNEVDENPFRRSERIDAFYDALQRNHINCTVRREFGGDIDAACGQLRAKAER